MAEPGKFGVEQVDSPEAREYSSRVLLHFIRHGEKESDPNKKGDEQLLTAAGRRQGLETGLKGPEAKPSAVAFGSDILRAQEMAGFDLAGAKRRDDITGEESLEELREKLNQDLNVGSKLAVDARLGFVFKSPDFKKDVGAAYKEGQGLKFMVENSDQLAEQLGDKESSTYSRIAANVSEVLDKYLTISPRFDEIVSNDEKRQYYSDTLERFMGSHAGVLDVFLCKLVEKLKGVEERNRLMESLDNNSFNFAEGFDIEIDMVGGEPQMRIRYSKLKDERGEAFEIDEVIPHEMLEEIIKEGKK